MALDWTEATFSVSCLAGFICMLSLCAFSAMLCEVSVSSSVLFLLHLVLGLAGTCSADTKNLRENMQACRKTKTSQTSITDDVCCPLTLPIPESHTASQPQVQPLLWSSELVTGPKGSVNPPSTRRLASSSNRLCQFHHKICRLITIICQAETARWKLLE